MNRDPGTPPGSCGASVLNSARLASREVAALERDRARRSASRAAGSGGRPCSCRSPNSPTSPTRLARPHLEAHILDGAHLMGPRQHAGLDREMLGEVAHRDDGHRRIAAARHVGGRRAGLGPGQLAGGDLAARGRRPRARRCRSAPAAAAYRRPAGGTGSAARSGSPAMDRRPRAAGPRWSRAGRCAGGRAAAPSAAVPWCRDGAAGETPGRLRPVRPRGRNTSRRRDARSARRFRDCG